MRPNLGGEGRDPSQLGQCPNFNRIWVLKASLIIICLLKYNIVNNIGNKKNSCRKSYYTLIQSL